MRVLIISYLPLSLTTNGGKHFTALFEEFKKEEIWQFYIANDLPDVTRCGSYFRKTDKDALLHHKGICIEATKSSVRKSSNNVGLANKKNNRNLKLLIRDLIWLSWRKKELYEWIESFRPDCIVSDTGDSCFLYNITKDIARKYHIPYIASFGDDYTELDMKNMSPISKLQNILLQRTIRKFVHDADRVITLNDMFSQRYRDKYCQYDPEKVQTYYMGSSLDFTNCPHARTTNKRKLTLAYLGNISLGRDENLIEIGNALAKYNSIHGTEHKLCIYTNENRDFNEKCKSVLSIELKGFVDSQHVRDVMLSSDILVHTESFQYDNVQKTMLSLSTKIADSLASGTCLLAYGPKEIASMDYLISNDCAYIVAAKDKLMQALEPLLEDGELRMQIALRGQRAALKNHNAKMTSTRFRKMIEGLV